MQSGRPAALQLAYAPHPRGGSRLVRGPSGTVRMNRVLAFLVWRLRILGRAPRAVSSGRKSLAQLPTAALPAVGRWRAAGATASRPSPAGVGPAVVAVEADQAAGARAARRGRSRSPAPACSSVCEGGAATRADQQPRRRRRQAEQITINLADGRISPADAGLGRPGVGRRRAAARRGRTCRRPPWATATGCASASGCWRSAARSGSTRR